MYILIKQYSWRENEEALEERNTKKEASSPDNFDGVTVDDIEKSQVVSHVYDYRI